MATEPIPTDNGGVSEDALQQSRAALAADDPGPLGLAVAAVAQRLGLAPATLRTWDRRYGLGPSGRSVGGHRRYTGEDILRLDLACRLMRQGYAPADAARAAIQTEIEAAPAHDLPPVMHEWEAPAPDNPEQAAAAVRGLLRAAYGLDAPACRGLIGATLERRGVVWTWDNLLAPTLIEVGRKWETSGGEAVEAEHLLSGVIEAELQGVVSSARATINTRPVMLASAPDDLHTLPLAAIAAALSERHISTRMLGARTPIDALQSAMTRVGPSAVVVWSQTAATGSADVMAAIETSRPGCVVVAAGPGWAPELPPGVERPSDLVDTVTRVTAAVR